MASNKKKKKGQQGAKKAKVAKAAAQTTATAAKTAQSSAPKAEEKGGKLKGLFKSEKKTANQPAKKKAKADKNANPTFFGKVKNYFKAVRTEMRRVVWPTKKELGNYSVAVICSLIVVGVVIAILDMVIGEGLVLFSGLRG